MTTVRRIWRVGRDLARGNLPVDDIAARIGRPPTPATRSIHSELAVFAVIGVLSTVLHLGGFVVLRQVMDSATAANALALLLAAVANTSANRRWTFGVHGRAGAARHQLQGLLVFALTLGLTTAALHLLQTTVPAAPTWLQTLVLTVSTAVATAVKYLAMKLWVFAPHPLRRPTPTSGRPPGPAAVVEPSEPTSPPSLAPR